MCSVSCTNRGGLLQGVVSGLNRGLAASEDDLRRADEAARELEEAGGPVDLTADLDKLQGRWKLIYSSAFSSRTLGGSRPGPPVGRLLPITLGQVWQALYIISHSQIVVFAYTLHTIFLLMQQSSQLMVKYIWKGKVFHMVGRPWFSQLAVA